jgi:hypothetical protein
LILSSNAIVWRHEAGKLGAAMLRPQLTWMSADHLNRAERLRQAKLLFAGNHRQFFVAEARSKQQYEPLEQGLPDFYEPLNLLGLMSRKFGDLLFGERVRVRCRNEQSQAIIDQIISRSWMHATLIAAATECSWAGDTYLEITRVNGLATIAHVPADEVYPVGVVQPDQQFGEYVRYATATARLNGIDTQLLLETRYLPGQIDRRLSVLDGSSGTLVRRDELTRVGADGQQPRTLDLWPGRRGGQPLPRTERTGLSVPSLVRVPNDYEGTSDYDGLLDAQDSVNAKHTQLGRVIARHADPTVAVPEYSAGPDGNLSSRARVYYFRTKDEIPQAITWNPELASALEDRRFALAAWSMLAEMPLSLLGLKDDSTAETAAKIRLNAVPALAKAQRKALFWGPSIAQVLVLALATEGMVVEVGDIAVEMRDGLPDDPESRANEIATLRSAGAISVRRSLEKQYLDQTAIEAELAELKQENASASPGLLLGEEETPTGGPSVENEEDDNPVDQDRSRPNNAA